MQLFGGDLVRISSTMAECGEWSAFNGLHVVSGYSLAEATVVRELPPGAAPSLHSVAWGQAAIDHLSEVLAENAVKAAQKAEKALLPKLPRGRPRKVPLLAGQTAKEARQASERARYLWPSTEQRQSSVWRSGNSERRRTLQHGVRTSTRGQNRK